MSFQAYIDNIKAKTGKSPEDFKQLVDKLKSKCPMSLAVTAMLIKDSNNKTLKELNISIKKKK